MGLFKDKVTSWFSVVAIDKKYDLKPLSESLKALLEVNTAELAGYNNYLVALFSIFIPIYFTFLKFNASLMVYILTIEINAIILAVLLRKIKSIKECNDGIIEQYNSIQSQLGGSFLVRLDGEKEKVIKQFKEWCKKYNFKLYNPKFKRKSQ